MLPATMIIAFIPGLEKVYSYLITVFEYSIDLFDRLNLIVKWNLPNTLYKTIFYILLYFFMINIKNKKREIIVFVSMVILVFSSIFINYPSNRFVRILDVNQGDAIHIHDNTCDMLIDTGDKDDYDNLISYFKGNNTYEIDILVITHQHSDHYGELLDIYENLNIVNLYINKNIEIINEYQILKQNDSFICGKSQFLVLNSDNKSSNENNNSIVLYGIIGDKKYLFTGDIEEEVENRLIRQYNLKVDILKIGHHGSNTSTSESFLNKLEPKISLISVGENNSYGFPNTEIINRLEKHSIEILRTDQLGTITIYHYELLNVTIIETYKKSDKRLYHYTIV
jgi:competence protein ComEC